MVGLLSLGAVVLKTGTVGTGLMAELGMGELGMGELGARTGGRAIGLAAPRRWYFEISRQGSQ